MDSNKRPDTMERITTFELAEKFIEEIKRMNKAMDIPEHFDFIKDEDIPTIVERALKEGNPLYPVPKIMDKEECAKVVRIIRGF